MANPNFGAPTKQTGQVYTDASDNVVWKAMQRSYPELGPKSAATPTITGTAQDAVVLTAVSSWVNAQTLSYQWYVNNQIITGATNSTYTVVTGNVGKKLHVRVHAVDATGGRAYADSAQTATVIA